MNNQDQQALAHLEKQSQGKLDWVFVNPEHNPEFKNFANGKRLGDFSYEGKDHNGKQAWKNHSITAVLSERQQQVYHLRDEADSVIAEKLGISIHTVKNNREAIKKKGF